MQAVVLVLSLPAHFSVDIQTKPPLKPSVTTMPGGSHSGQWWPQWRRQRWTQWVWGPFLNTHRQGPSPALPRCHPPPHLVKWSERRSVVSDSLWPHGLYSLWNSPGQNTGVGSLSLLQGIFPTQGSNPGLLHCRQIHYQLSHSGSPRILEWVAYPFSRGSSRPRNRTWASCIAGRFFTNLAIREAQRTTTLSKNMDESCIHNIKWKKPNTRLHIDSISKAQSQENQSLVS